MTACNKKTSTEIGETDTKDKPNSSLDYDINEIFNWAKVSDDFENAKKEAYEVYDEVRNYNEQQARELCEKMFPLMCSFYENGRSIYTLEDACTLYKYALMLSFVKEDLSNGETYLDVAAFTRDAIVALYGGYDDTEFQGLVALQDAIFMIEDLGIATYQPSEN